MSQLVTLKWNKYGVTLILDNDSSFKTLLEAVELKFKDASRFFKDAKTAICFEGRKLSEEEEQQLIEVIEKTASLEIICIIDSDKEREEFFKRIVEDTLKEKEELQHYEEQPVQSKDEIIDNKGQFYRGTLRSGQILESDGDVIVLGDVNPGAKVVAARNVVILGCLKGTVYAGLNGIDNAFVVAMSMNPMQIRIGDCIARSADSNQKFDNEPKIAFLEDGNIYIEQLCKNVIDDMKLIK